MAPIQDYKPLCRKLIEDAYNNKNNFANNISTYVADNVNDHGIPAGDKNGLTGLKDHMKALYTAFPDARWTNAEFYQDGDYVTIRSVFTGTHKGDLMGLRPTNKQVNVDTVDLLRFQNGKVVEHWGGWEAAAFCTQLGLVKAVTAA